MLLHRPREGVTERLDDPGIIRPGGVVEGETLAAVPGEHGDRRLYPVDPETGREIGVYKITVELKFYEPNLAQLCLT